MKVGKAVEIYRPQLQGLWQKKREIAKQKEELEEQRKYASNDKEIYEEEAVRLELSYNEVAEKYEETKSYFEKVMEVSMCAWNAEVTKQQADAIKDYGEDMAKCLEIARRIAKGAKVPSTDEQKLMEFNRDIYMAAKNMAMMNQMKEKEEYDSLWGEEEPPEEYNPKEAADNAEVGMEAPEIVDVAAVGENMGKGE